MPDILGYYLNISTIPILINNPCRTDNNPSLGLSMLPDGNVYYKDFATGDSGDGIKLLMELWKCSRVDAYKKIEKDLLSINKKVTVTETTKSSGVRVKYSHTELGCKIREWKDYDLEYWNRFGIDLNTLKKAEVYPISYKFFYKDGKQNYVAAPKYSYAFIERKEGKITMKLYSPFIKGLGKWFTSTDKSVISLWTLLPEKGDKVCICSSLKDSLTMMCNTNIPSICPQGEKYPISNTAMKVLKSRFNEIYVIYDNDEPGIEDAKALCFKHNIINVTLPEFKKIDGTQGKDLAELRESYGKEKFNDLIIPLLEESKEKWINELPF